DVEIGYKRGTILCLQCEVAELRRRSEQHKVIIAPIRRVPAEIMAEISYNSLPSRRNQREVQPALHRAPLIFGQVSSQWRAISLSTPMLWNSIFL
ncbi:hypothetical protein C8R45DRAFT_788861, partial [Mycena sanguinolenta]